MAARSMAETPREKYERLQKAVQNAILNGYPNPGREGCPGGTIVREVAFREDLTKDPVWEHITHCSPCYADFLKYKDEWRRQKGESA